MTKEFISTGKTIDDAVDAGLLHLNLERDDVSIEVLETPSRGFLGIGATLAKIKISYEVPDEKAEVKVAPVQASVPPKKEKELKKEKAEKKEAPAAKAEEKKDENVTVTLSAEELAQIKVFVTELLAKMKITGCEVSVALKEDASLAVTVKGDAGGVIIGRHGETLDAIQYIISLFVNKNKDRSFIRVNFDAENYRFKRKETLERLARQKASIAIKKKGNITMEPMQAYERRIIHASLQNYNNITTYSIGEEPRRRVVISYSQGK